VSTPKRDWPRRSARRTPDARLNASKRWKGLVICVQPPPITGTRDSTQPSSAIACPYHCD
jgi:hypothetical protein